VKRSCAERDVEVTMKEQSEKYLGFDWQFRCGRPGFSESLDLQRSKRGS